MNDDETQQIYMEYRELTEQLQKIQQYLEQTTENIGEIANIIDALDEYAQLEKGSRIFAPIANGIFIDATLNDPSIVRMNVGGGVVVQKPVAEGKKILESQRKELEELQERATRDRMTILGRLKEIETIVEGEKDEKDDSEAEPAPKTHTHKHKK